MIDLPIVLGEQLRPDGEPWASGDVDDFRLPVDIVTEAIAILAKRGSGKTYTAAVLVEQIVKAGQPVAVIDPTGAWWGLRSSADGDSEGLPFVIFGGDHGDLPLEPAAGKLVADLLVDERVLAVLDLSALSKAAGKRFMADFLERLYHRNREPFHIVIDEADEFAPQRTSAEGARLLGAMEDLVRRGRIKGLGVTLITQRPAVLHKDVLSQVEILVALRMTGLRDVEAIDDWVRLHADDEQAQAIKRSLPSLPVGTGWFWSPALGLRSRVAIAKRETFDSSKTPKVGERRLEPKRFAPVDLAALGEQMATMAERAADDDPKRLRSRIAALEVELAEAQQRRHVDLDPERLLATATQIDSYLAAAAAAVHDSLAQLGRPIEPPAGAKKGLVVTHGAAALPVPTVMPAQSAGTPNRRETPRTAPAQPAAPSAPSGALTSPQRTILTALAQLHDVGGTRSRMRLLTGYSPKGSHYRNTVSSLRTAGYVFGQGDELEITLEGEAALGHFDPPPAGTKLLEWWRDKLTAPERQLLDHLVAAHPRALTGDELGGLAGYSPAGSHFRNTLSHLRTLDLVVGDRRALSLHPDFADLIRVLRRPAP